jgi:hypothetical protein
LIYVKKDITAKKEVVDKKVLNIRVKVEHFAIMEPKLLNQLKYVPKVDIVIKVAVIIYKRNWS